MIKPPYKVPTMQEINEKPWNGFNVVSTFSGCGGSSLGYRMAGFKVLWASEFIDAARDSYRANAAPYTVLDGRDIRQVTKYSDKSQRTDDLFYEYIRLIKGLKPKVFLAENVSGLIKGTAKGYFLEILSAMKACGYQVSCRVLDAKWLGVPQQRQRTIFIGVRDDIGIKPIHPKPLDYQYTVRDALPWIVAKGPMHTIQAGAGARTSSSWGHGTCIVEAETDISKYAIGKEWDIMGKPGSVSDKYFSLVRPDLDRPCPTITSTGSVIGAASVVHPTEKRKLSIAELKRICGFPDDFILTGTYSQKWERCGRAVPPVMMSHIAATILDQILKKIKK